MSEEYIRGTRQLKAIPFFVEMVLRRNWLGARRELEIMSGFAKPYAACFRCGVCGRTLPFVYWDGAIVKDTGEFVCTSCVDKEVLEICMGEAERPAGSCQPTR
jgi:hypothetical protein